MDDFGLMFYNARWYDPTLGRFAQADTIVLSGVQGYDRYNYANNSPAVFADPTGHVSCSGSNWDDGPQCKDKAEYQTKAIDEYRRILKKRFEWHMNGNWTIGQLSIVFQAGVEISSAVDGDRRLRALFGSVDFDLQTMRWGGLGDAHHVTLNSAGFDTWTVVHELGHSWDADYGWAYSRDLQRYTGGYTNIVLSIIKKAIGNCDAASRLPGCNNAGYFYGSQPPHGSNELFNSQEDFAESFAAYVNPAQATHDVSGYVNDPTYGDLLGYSNYKNTLRWSYIYNLLH